MPDGQPRLLDAQRAFALAVRDSAQLPEFATMLALDPECAARRLAVYRGNVVSATHKALAATYPAVEQIVGADTFAGLARAYWKQTPSVSGDLADYGAGLGDFVEHWEPTSSLPYLADVARLEWCVHRAHGAADAVRLDPAAWAEVDPSQQGALCFAFLPGTALLASDHPIARLWEIHQPEFAGEFSVEWGGAGHALVARAGFQVTVRALDAGAFALYHSLLSGAPLLQALDAALAAQPGVDGPALLVDLLHSGPIAGFRLPLSSKDPV